MTPETLTLDLPPRHTWRAEIEHRIEIITQEIDRLRTWGARIGFTPQEIDVLIAPQKNILRELYSNELHLAEVLDQSDFVVGVEGEAAHLAGAAVSTLVTVLDRTKQQYAQVLKAQSGELGRKKLPKHLEPTVVGMAAASIVVGFKAPRPTDAHLLHDDNPVYENAVQAMRHLAIAGRMVAEHKTIDEIAEVIDNPVVREAAVRAIGQLVVGNKSGFERVVFTGQVMEGGPVTLSPKDVKLARELVKKPTQRSERQTFVGEIREIDLDQRKFDLRRVRRLDPNHSIQCNYTAEMSSVVREGLDHRVRVTGICEFDREGLPRLLRVEEIKMENPPEQGVMFEMS